MSRVGKHPIDIPSGVNVAIAGQTLTAKGRMGQMETTLMKEVQVSQEGSQVSVRPRDDSGHAHMMWGTARTMVANLIRGVDTGFARKLEINGVGYRAQMQGKDLVLSLGYSHEVRYPVPEGVKIECPDPTHINIHGSSRQRVGQVAAEIRGFRKVERYKGKGIKYDDEIVRRKEGKKK